MDNGSFAGRVNRRLQFFARYWVSTILLIYAAPKLMGTQFRVLESVYDTPLGQVSDFWLAWSFFARSYNYQLMLGCAEITIAFLLIFRRTKTLGALCSLPITINIIMVDYFFGVATGAFVVAATLFLGAVYLLFPEFPRIKALFWDEQNGSSSSRTIAASLIYGVVVLASMIGLIMFVARISPRTYDGAYKIERYSIAGMPQTLSPGKYGTDPVLYLEVRNSTVLSLNGNNTIGSYSVDPVKQEFVWTPDRQAPDTFVTGTFETIGDEMTLKGRRGSDDIEMMLKRVSRHPG